VTQTALTPIQKAYGPFGEFAGSPNYPLGTVVRTRETVRRQWFSGAFTYYIPDGLTARSRMSKFAAEADKLFGISLSPDTLWNLAPWTWAIDWFGNAGDVLSTYSDTIQHGLVMRYGYIMEHTIVRDTYTLSSSGLSMRIQDQVVPPISYVTETKLRRKANPFGFGVSWDGLSPKQLSIAAALGLSRGS